MVEMNPKDEENEEIHYINTTYGYRVSQACDRCRIKKTRCDGGKPCAKCKANGFECLTSDKLTRKSFPKGYTVSLENRVKELEEAKSRLETQVAQMASGGSHDFTSQTTRDDGPTQDHNQIDSRAEASDGNNRRDEPPSARRRNHAIQMNNPIDKVFNLNQNGVIIGNDNINFESQFNHLLINLNLPFLKITNSHNYLLNDPDSYLYHPSYLKYNAFHNKDLGIIYNPLTIRRNDPRVVNGDLPTDIYELFIKLVNNFKNVFNSKRELDQQVSQYFLYYNTFVPILDYTLFMGSYDAFHTMYPFIFTYDDATINGFNLLSDDYLVVDKYLMVVIQIYAMMMMSDPTLNLNLLLNHENPSYKVNYHKKDANSSVKSLYDFLPYLNIFHVSMNQLQTYLLFFYHSLLTNNKEKSLLLSSLINSFIGILGVNLNVKNLFFNDLSLSYSQRRDRVKIFWSFKVLLKLFNLKFGYKPSINTTVINPITIERYFELTPEKLSQLIDDPKKGEKVDRIFNTLLKPSIEFLNLINIIIPSSFSPNYYQYLKSDRQEGELHQNKKTQSNKLDWILNDDDGDGNDGNLNYNYSQFLTIDKNLSNWRYSLNEQHFDSKPFEKVMGLARLSEFAETTLYNRISFEGDNTLRNYALSHEALLHYANYGQPDVHTAIHLIKMQLNFHYLLIRSMNYLNFVIDRELTQSYYVKIANISREVLAHFIIIFEHVGNSKTESVSSIGEYESSSHLNPNMGHHDTPSVNNLDMDEDGFIINDFSIKRRKPSQAKKSKWFPGKEIPLSPFNSMLNALSLTMINFKKSIILQMLYLLICNLKIAKRGGMMSTDSLWVLNTSISLFIRVFINYKPAANNFLDTKKLREDFLFTRILNDELKAEFLNDKTNSFDFGTFNHDLEADIDWDDEHMDEDLKYLKILKYVQYKTNCLYTRSSKKASTRVKTPSTPMTTMNSSGGTKSHIPSSMVQLPPLVNPSPKGIPSQNMSPTYGQMSNMMLSGYSANGGISLSNQTYNFAGLEGPVEQIKREQTANELMHFKNSGRNL